MSSLAVVLIISTAVPIPVEQAQSVLRQVADSFGSRPPMTFHSESVLEHEAEPAQTRETHQTDVFWDHGRCRYNTTFILGTVEHPSLSRETVSLWDGSRYLSTKRSSRNGNTHGYFSDNPARHVEPRISAETGAQLDGIFRTADPRWHSASVTDVKELHYATILLENGGPEHTELVSDDLGNEKLHFVSHTAFGDYDAWLSPEPPYSLARLAITLNKDQLGDQTPALHAYQKWVLDITRVEPVDGVSMPVEGVISGEAELVGQEGIFRWKQRIARSNIILNPDFEALHAFTLDLPLNAPLTNLDLPGLTYYWNGHALVPHMDNKAMEDMTQAVNDLHAAAAAQPPPQLSAGESDGKRQEGGSSAGWKPWLALAALGAMAMGVAAWRRHGRGHRVRGE